MNQAKTILYSPPDWANFVAFMFLSTHNQKEADSQIIRLSPLIHFDSNTPNEIQPIIKSLHKLDMDLTKDSDIDLIINCYREWKNGKILNQPIDFKVERNNDLNFKSGDFLYEDAMKRWNSW